MASSGRWYSRLFPKDPDAELRELCSAKIHDLVPPASTPFSFDTFLRSLESRRGRSIRLHPWENATPSNQMCGAWISTSDVDHVYYAANTSETHQRHIVLHEIAHMLWGHELLQDDRGLAVLFPDLDPLVVRRVLLRKRARYNSLEERQAEMTASLLGEMVDRMSVTTPRRGALGRLQETLGGSVGTT